MRGGVYSVNGFPKAGSLITNIPLFVTELDNGGG